MGIGGLLSEVITVILDDVKVESTNLINFAEQVSYHNYKIFLI